MLYERYLRAYAEQFRKTDRNMWNYEDSCVLIGLCALYRATEDEQFFRSLREFTDRYIEQDGTIRHYAAEEYNLDYIPAGRVLFTLYEKMKEPRYRKAIENLEEQLRHQPRTKCGSFWHKGIYPNQVWLDGLYMGLLFHTEYALKFGDAATLEILCCNSEMPANIFTMKRPACIITHSQNQKRAQALPQGAFLYRMEQARQHGRKRQLSHYPIACKGIPHISQNPCR